MDNIRTFEVQPVTIARSKQYKIDFDKVKTLDDVKAILKSLDISYSEYYIEGIEHLVVEDKGD